MDNRECVFTCPCCRPQDDTHFSIAMAAVEAGMHVLVTKPAVKTLQRHHELAAAAAKHNVLVRVGPVLCAWGRCGDPPACTWREVPGHD